MFVNENDLNEHEKVGILGSPAVPILLLQCDT